MGIISGIIGSFIVLRGVSLMGDAISHAILPGVAISYLLGINYFYGAVLVGILASLGIGAISQNSRIKNDASIGIVFSAAFALGIILITIAVGIIVISVVALFYKELLVSSFDETMAAVYGLKTRLIHYGIMVLLTLVTVASLQTVGVILVISMLVTPASTAYLLTDRLSIMIILASSFGALSAIIGIYFSYIYNLPSGPVIALAATAIFLLALIFSPKQGLLWEKIESRKQKKLNNI